MIALLLAFGLWLAAAAGISALRAGGTGVRAGVPVVTATCTALVAATSLTQLALAPDLLPLLMRNGTSSLTAEPWRLATSLLVQDDGWPGFAFNLVSLLIIGSLAERVLGRLRWLAIAGCSVAAAQGIALAWQPIGAGNSILTFGLAGGLCAASLLSRRLRTATMPALVASGCFVALLIARDIHGAAGVAGALVECGFAREGGAPSPNQRSAR